jgi:hypothetical protein
MNRVLHTAILASSLLVSFLAGPAESTPVQTREADPTRLLLCNAARPSLADFDQNGITDRIDSSDAPGPAAVWLTLNGRPRVMLAEATEACGLLVVDIDHDADPDLVALTASGRLLIWRNQGGALRLVRPQQHSDVPGPTTSLTERTRPLDSVVPNGRTLPCTVPACRAHAVPFGISRISDIATSRSLGRSNSSASRAPPTF